jgi:hypothetical protein
VAGLLAGLAQRQRFTMLDRILAALKVAGTPDIVVARTATDLAGKDMSQGLRYLIASQHCAATADTFVKHQGIPGYYILDLDQCR